MPNPNDTVFIYVLQRISDKQYLYIGSAKNPKIRFSGHRKHNPYPAVKRAFAESDIRFLVVAQTTEANRIDVEHSLWRQFIEAGHPIVNVDPAYTSYRPERTSWNKGQKGRVFSEEHKRKLSESAKRKRLSEEHKRHIGEAGKNRPAASQDTRQKISNALRGKSKRPHTEEEKQKVSSKLKGRPSPTKGVPHTEEARLKMSLAQKGKQRAPLSVETKRKISESNKGKHGHIVNEETRLKMSAAAKSRWARKKSEDKPNAD